MTAVVEGPIATNSFGTRITAEGRSILDATDWLR